VHPPRPPSIDRGTTSFIWAIGFGLYIWLFALGVGVSGAVAAILAALSAGGIYLLVRVYGEKDVRRPRSRRGA
jgi:hypothetical protein